MSETKIQRRQDKWSEKVGLVSKSYKLPKSTVQEFQETCARLGVSMGPQIAKMMQEFIDDNK